MLHITIFFHFYSIIYYIFMCFVFTHCLYIWSWTCQRGNEDVSYQFVDLGYHLFSEQQQH